MYARQPSNGNQPVWNVLVVKTALALVTGRWVLPTLKALEYGPLRRRALRAQIGEVSEKVLTETLRRMEADNLIDRTTIPSVPIEVDYGLTAFARELWPLLAQIDDWARCH